MNYDNKPTVKIFRPVFDYFDTLIKERNFRLETGGILIGTLHPLKNEIHLTDLTTPQRMDRQLPYRFIRNSAGHQEIMDDLWRKSNYEKLYLGEWHSHNERHPTPSPLDTRNWLQITNKKQNTSQMLFAIVGIDEFRVWTVANQTITPLAKELLYYVK